MAQGTDRRTGIWVQLNILRAGVLFRVFCKAIKKRLNRTGAGGIFGAAVSDDTRRLVFSEYGVPTQQCRVLRGGLDSSRLTL
jgi:hypothetical protein